MGRKETVEVLVDGGKAVAGQQMGSALGPLKINLGQVINQINEKTKDFKGMKVPVKVIVDVESKEFTLEIGTPPASELIKKEINIQTASGEPNKLFVGVIAIEQVIKIAKMKKDSLFIRDLKSAVKIILGSCNSMGVLVENKKAIEVIEEVNNGKYDNEIKNEVTEAPKSKLDSFKVLQKELEKKVQESKKKKEQEKAAKEAAKETTPAAAEKK